MPTAAHPKPSSLPSRAFAATPLATGRPTRWLALSALATILVVSAVLGAHLAWAQRHFRPPELLTEELMLRARGASFNTGLEDGFRIVEANGKSVGDLAGLHRALDSGVASRAHLVVRRSFEGVSEEHVLIWIPVTSTPRIDLSDDLSLAGDQLDPALATQRFRVVAINGQPTTGRAQADRLLSTSLLTTRLSLAPLDGTEVKAEVAFLLHSWKVQWALWTAGVCFGVIAWWVLHLAPHRRSSWGFAGFALGMALFLLLRSVPHAYRVATELHLLLVLEAFLPALTVGFLGTFTPLRLLVRRLSPWLLAACCFGAVLLALNVLLYPDAAAIGLFGDALFVAWLLSTLALVLIAQPTDFYFRLRGKPLGATDRQRARVLRLASLGAFVPSPLFYLGIYAGVSNFEARFWVELAILVFPIMVAYAILRHNLLEVNELVREGALAGILLLALAAVYAASAATLAPLAASWLPSGAGWVQPAVMGGAVLGLTPLYLQGRALIHRRFERPSPDFLRLADAFDETLQAGTSAQQFCDSAVRRIAGAAGNAGVHLLLWSERQASWWLAATTDSPPSGPDHDRAGAALALLRSRLQPLVRDDLIEEMRSGGERLAVLDGMRELGAAMLLPLTSRGRLLGALAIGDRQDGRNLRAEDLRLVERVRSRLSQHLDHLFQERAALDRGKRIVDIYPEFPAAIGPYQIEGVLGRGGTSYVYLGHTASGPAAVKVPNDKVQSNPRALQRFHRESLAMQRLQHPNIARVLEVGWHGREPYIAFEYFSQGSLDARLEIEGRLSEDDARGVAVQVTKALAAALEQGVIHRDVKLRNLFQADDSTVKLGDFGLALVDDATTLTTHPMLMGTPAYMSPEQALGKPATWKSDQYALGICLYELLAGERPFWAETSEVLLFLQVHKPLPDITQIRPDVTPATRELLERMTAKDPASRFESYDALARSLTLGKRPLERGAE